MAGVLIRVEVVMTTVLIAVDAVKVAAVEMEGETVAVIHALKIEADAALGVVVAMIVGLARILLAVNSSVEIRVRLVIRMLLHLRNVLPVLLVNHAFRKALVLRDPKVPANCVWF